jgi:MOSC domain-containing protein YiiM
MNEGDGRIEALWVKRAHRGKMDEVAEATLVEGRGMQGSADQGRARQVTVIAREVFDALRDELDTSVDPAMRRANVLVSGVRLEHTRGRVLELGGCRIEIAGETRPCERMDEAVPGLRSALDPEWRGGVYGRVIRGGALRVGDVARLIPDSDAAHATPTDVDR